MLVVTALFKIFVSKTAGQFAPVPRRNPYYQTNYTYLHLSILRFTVVLSFIFKLFVLDLVVSASDGEGFCMGATTREGDGADT